VDSSGGVLSSFCNYLQQNASAGTSGVSTTGGGGFCQTSTTLSYSICGGAGIHGAVGGGPVWGALRAVVASNGHLPGQYNKARAEAAGKNFDRSLAMITTQVSSLSTIAQDLRDGHAVYLAQTVTPAVIGAINTTGLIIEHTQADIVPVLGEDTAGVPEPQAPFSMTPPSSVLTEKEARVREASDDPAKLWRELEPVYRVHSRRLAELPAPDRRAIADLYSLHFDENGIVRAEYLREDVRTLQAAASAALRSTDSSGAMEVRLQVNRALTLLSHTSDAQYEAAAGALGLALGADSALAEGSYASYEAMLPTIATMFDIAIGLTPAGSANDLLQILHGMATGRDYTGAPMEAADYALRGLGIVFGVLPGGGAAVRIGSKQVHKAFVWGAELLRKTNLKGRLFDVVRDTRALVGDFAEVVGEILPYESLLHNTPEEIAEKVNQVLLLEDGLVKGTGRQWIEEVWLRVRETGRALDDGAVKLFNEHPTAIDLPEDRTFSRVVHREKAADIVAGARPLSDGAHNEAFITAARDLTGYDTSATIAKRLGLYQDEFGTQLRDLSEHVILTFTYHGPLYTPVNFDLTNIRLYGWMYGGLTKGDAREWIVNADAVQRGLVKFVGDPRHVLP
jgi:hypothetical protein